MLLCLINVTLILGYLIGYLLILHAVTHELKSNAYDLTNRIIRDITINNGQWDISRYNADPLTPYPNGSSGFVNPLYIFTSEGFVIERNRPIDGYLDSSDFKHINTFTTPQTITAVTGEQWRVYSKPIVKDNTTAGVIMVSYYNPQATELSHIDKILLENSDRLAKQINVNDNGDISIANVDIRNIHYEVSFEVVNSFNKVLVNNGRTPSFIDTSYIAKEAEQTGYKRIKPANSHDAYYVYTEKLFDSNTHQFKGLVVSAIPANPASQFVTIFTRYAILIGLMLTPLLSSLSYLYHRYSIKAALTNDRMINRLKNPTSYFDDKKGIIYLNNDKFFIPLQSKQFYLAQALFSDPEKLWDQEELLHKLGEEPIPENWRKVYDAMLAVNKKVGRQLITQKNRNYTLASLN